MKNNTCSENSFTSYRTLYPRACRAAILRHSFRGSTKRGFLSFWKRTLLRCAFTLFRVKSSRSHAFAAAFEPRKSFGLHSLERDSFDSEKSVYRAAHGSELSVSAQIINNQPRLSAPYFFAKLSFSVTILLITLSLCKSMQKYPFLTNWNLSPGFAPSIDFSTLAFFMTLSESGLR